MPSSTSPQWLNQHGYAHRGLHGDGVPENSLASFEAAIEAGLGIECDVRKAGDGRAMVFHDAELDRLTNDTGSIAELTVGNLTAIKLGNSEERIPTLRDTLELVGGRVPLLIELKSDEKRSVGPLCRAVRRDLEGYHGQVAVMSFDKRVVQWFAEKQPDIIRGLVMTEEGARTLAGAIKRRLLLASLKMDFLAYNIEDLPSPVVARYVKGGGVLLSWTVRNSSHLETAAKAGAAPILEAGGVAAWQARS